MLDDSRNKEAEDSTTTGGDLDYCDTGDVILWLELEFFYTLFIPSYSTGCATNKP